MAAKKEMIAMLLAGGQGSRLGILTERMAKPAVMFGGKYRIIDFPLSNCINSGIDTVGVMTQYLPLRLNRHIGIGIPWDLDRNNGGITILSPFERPENSSWYQGTADAVYQNIDYIDSFSPDYVLILSADHIYKMDYELMLSYHKSRNAAVTMAAMPVPPEEASRFGILITEKETGRVRDFQEKPENPKSNLASMGIYIFNWQILRGALLRNKDTENLDFGKHIIPYCHKNGDPIYCYEYDSYWKDVGTLESYWQANMELVDLVPVFNLYEEYWKIYTNSETSAPIYMAEGARTERSIIGNGCIIKGEVRNSVLGSNVVVEEGALVEDSIIMRHTHIGEDTHIHKAIIAEDCEIGGSSEIGIGAYRPSSYNPKIYNSDLVVIGDNSVTPAGISVGKNTVIYGVTTESDYPDHRLLSGEAIVKEGELS